MGWRGWRGRPRPSTAAPLELQAVDARGGKARGPRPHRWWSRSRAGSRVRRCRVQRQDPPPTRADAGELALPAGDKLSSPTFRRIVVRKRSDCKRSHGFRSTAQHRRSPGPSWCFSLTCCLTLTGSTNDNFRAAINRFEQFGNILIQHPYAS